MKILKILGIVAIVAIIAVVIQKTRKGRETYEDIEIEWRSHGGKGRPLGRGIPKGGLEEEFFTVRKNPVFG